MIAVTRKPAKAAREKIFSVLVLDCSVLTEPNDLKVEAGWRLSDFIALQRVVLRFYPVVWWQTRAHCRLDREYRPREFPTSDRSEVTGLPHVARKSRHKKDPRWRPKEMRLSSPPAPV